MTAWARHAEREKRVDLKKFENGTLVEYKDGCGFEREWGRARILSVREDNGRVAFVTDGPAHFRGMGFSSFSKQEIEGVLYFAADYLGFMYAVAPPSVGIPAPDERKFRILFS